MPAEVRFNIADRCPGRTIARDHNLAAGCRYPSVLQRISNQDGDSSRFGATGDAARRSDERRGNEAETRDRAARFRAALGKREAEAGRWARASWHAQRAQERIEERGS